MGFLFIRRWRLFNTLSVLALALSLVACAATTDVNSRYYSIPAGSKFVLHQDLNIPAGKAHIEIQGGQAGKGLNNSDVGCELEVRTLGPGVVKADTFIIRRAESSQEWINEPHTMRFYRTLYLQSDTQPDVIKLVCSYWSYPLFGDDIPMSDIRAALGDVASLEFPR